MFGSDSEAESNDEAPIVLIRRKPEIDQNSDVSDEELDSLEDPDEFELPPLGWTAREEEACDYSADEQEMPDMIRRNYEDPNAVYTHENFSWSAKITDCRKKVYGCSIQPGQSPLLSGLREPIEIVDMFFTAEIVDWIQICTNEYAKSNEADFPEVDAVELKAFFAALILNGAYGKGTACSMFSTCPVALQLPISMAFSQARFEKLVKYLRFDKVSERKKDEKDQLHKIRHVFESLVEKFKANYICGEIVTVDEAIIAYRGKSGFRQYIKNKPCKYGMKAWACNDSTTLYLHNAQICTGKDDDAPEVGQAHRMALRMVENLTNCGRMLCTNNFYTSPELVRQLHSVKTSFIGVVRANKSGIPRELVKSTYQIDRSGKNFEPRTGFLYCQNRDCIMTLVKYEAKHRRSIFLLSSKHTDAMVDTSVAQQPEVLYAYNASKVSIDLMDHMLGMYSCSLPTRRWSLRVFYWLLDVVYFNSFVIYNRWNSHANVPEMCHRRRNFLKSAACDFLQVQITRRLSQENVPPHVRRLADVANAVEALDLTRDNSTDMDFVASSASSGESALLWLSGRFSRESSRLSCASSRASSASPVPSTLPAPITTTITKPKRRSRRKRAKK